MYAQVFQHRGSRIGTNSSIRRSRFRGIQSALLMKILGLPPCLKYKTRACSRKRSTMETTVIFSLSPFTPGRRQQTPLILSLTLTPAWLAAYNASMISGSTKAFSFATISPFCPCSHRILSCSINPSNLGRRNQVQQQSAEGG